VLVKKSIRRTTACVLAIAVLAGVAHASAASPGVGGINKGAKVSALAQRATPPSTSAPPATTPPATTPPTTAPPTTGPGTGSGHFPTLPPGAALPSDADCAARVRPVAEQRPSNAIPNATKGTGTLTVGTGMHPVTGAFTGTTDEIIQWAACKWGIDEDMARAQIARESWWRQDAVGDNGESFGLGQVRTTSHAAAFTNDNAKKSSAFNLDYTYAVWRTCYNGEYTWLNSAERSGTYAAGDAWGCFGVWFSGRWHTAPANTYIAAVQDYLNQRIWTTPGFQNG
jgi:autotransporter family porin